MNIDKKEFRCSHCNHLLGKFTIEQGTFTLFIKCRKCKTLNANTFQTKAI